jgi:predicted Zn-dependent protease
MVKAFHSRIMTRRQFLWVSSLSAGSLATGCATNPVTGKSQLMLLSESDEIRLDQQNSPHQFSADYGAVQDPVLNKYLNDTGLQIASLTHRPGMPYSFRAVNANYVNAYAFPGGSIGITRGILLSLENEAELAGLIGHELGHVNARHTARLMSRNMLTSVLVTGIAAYVQYENETYAGLTAGLGMLGSGLLLAHYSRDNEREADALGIDYIVRKGFDPEGFTGLMSLLQNLSKHKPNALELMFATHPMSDERFQTAVQTIRSKYSGNKNQKFFRERYMDQTANLRKLKEPIEEMQKGELMMAREKYVDAESHFSAALKTAPRDYTALILMAKCQFAQEKYAQAEPYLDRAKDVYPEEAQSHLIAGVTKLHLKQYEPALNRFTTCQEILPGNPNTTFLKGFALENLDRIKDSASEYTRYLQAVSEGKQAEYAYSRLVEWGYEKTESTS